MKKDLMELSAEKLTKSFDEFAASFEKRVEKKGSGSCAALGWLLVVCRDCYGKEMVNEAISFYRQSCKK